MGIALLALVDLLSPLQSLANRWIPARAPNPDGAVGPRHVAARPTRGPRAATSVEVDRAPLRATATQKPLRVVRTVDAQRHGGVTGRLVLSGRLVDVCAELDRLAALEAVELSRSAGTLH
ncbi:MAG: hypothetical protein EOP72_00720 [Variovorax sp.]|nr:MAG: hypothetical protein EOP72_00720 [Variovorax sp.]